MFSFLKISILQYCSFAGNYLLALIFVMVLSNAQPVQFWLAACSTFNQHEAEGVYHRCFCQPFSCADNIRVQFTESSDISPPAASEYTLEIRDENGAPLLTLPFDVAENAADFIYSASFVPEDTSPDLCDRLIQLVIVGDGSDIAKSDCLDIGTHRSSILINYRNHRNFAGLVYQDISPEFEFELRVPAIFYHQKFPDEDETMELSTSLVNLNGNLRKQRFMDIDYVPYYFHEKLKLVLKHQFITIFDKEWIKQEAYEIVEGNKRWPIKKASIWLSEKEYIHRNVL